MTTQSKSLRLADDLVNSPYGWPGGYPRFAFVDDGGILCPKCCEKERELIGTTIKGDGWTVVAIETNWEDDNLYCSHCDKKIESTYGDFKLGEK